MTMAKYIRKIPLVVTRQKEILEKTI